LLDLFALQEEDSTEPNLDIWGGDGKGDALPKKGMKRLMKNVSLYW
jgi:hypothetical protein